MAVQQPLNVGMTGGVDQLWSGIRDYPGILIINPDTSNTVYVGYVSTIAVNGINTIPLGPGQSVTLDGSTDIYAIATRGTTATVVIPGGSNFFQPTTLSNLGGITVFVQGSAPTGTIPLNSIWINTVNGSINNWNGSSWVEQTFNAQNLIQAGTIVAALIQANTITASQIAANTITAGQIAAATITATQIAANTITAAKIVAGTITATQIAANTITAAKIAANTITASQIAANTITASQLSAGIVYAGIVDGTTITGADIVADGSNGGYFAYSGTPALGNLIGTVSPVAIATNDPLGNLVIPGVTSYGVSVGTNYAVQMLAGVSGLPAITVYTGSSPAGPFTSVADIQFDSSGDMTLNATGTLTLGSVANLPQVQSVAGLAVSLSGSKQANPASAGTYPITVTNTTQTSLGFMSVPQGDVQIGTTYDIHAAGFFSTGTSVPSSATFNLHWGGITGTNIGSLIIPGTILASASLLGWTFDSEINWASTTEAIVTIMVGWHTATGVGGSATYFTVSDTTGLVTNSGNKNLSLGFVWGSAPMGTSLTCNAFRAGRIA